MHTRFWRTGVLAVVVLTACGAWSQAQTFGTYPHSPASAVLGVWYEEGNPALPCYVNVAPGGRMAIFTDATGQKAHGRIVGRGRVMVNVGGTGLLGEVNGGVLFWSDGSYWTR